MSSRIETHDVQEGLAQAWHGKTVVRQEITTQNAWLAGWDVFKRPLHRLRDDMSSPTFEQSAFYEITCTDNPSIIIGEPVSDSYGVISNAQFLNVVGNALAQIEGAQIESAGSVCNRGKLFVSVRVPELTQFEAAGREFKPFLNFLTSHDTSTPLVVNASNICTVCANTFHANLNLRGTQRTSVRHTKNALLYLDDVSSVVSGWLNSQVTFKRELDTMREKRVTVDQADAFFAGFLTVSLPSIDLSTRTLNKVNRLVELFRFGKGNEGENRADVFSAITDYYSHESAGGNLSKQLAADYASGGVAKNRAFNSLADDDTFAQLVSRGKTVLA